MALEQWVEVTNKCGLHARVATELVKTASRFRSNITVFREGYDQGVDGKSILALMTIGAESGTRLLLRIEGDDADGALRALVDRFDRAFDEER